MKHFAFRRAFALVLGIAAASTVLAQTATQRDPSQGNPYIKVPSSSRYIYGVNRTHYLIYTGVPVSSGAFYSPYGYPVAMRGPAAFAPTIPGYHPADIRTAYKLPNDGGSGAIAIVDAFNLSSALSDFNTFSTTFGLPTESSTDPTSSSNKVFQIVYSTGAKPNDDDTGWGGEIALDIEWAHAIAPKAKIYLVEAPDNSDNGLFGAVQVAANLPGVREVSNSWGGDENSGELGLDSDFVHPGVVFFASSGDIGGLQSYPAISPNVVGVGGTSMQLTSSGQILSETAWSGAGGGPSAFEPRPDFQSKISGIVGLSRGCPDVSAIADPYTGVAVYSSKAFGTAASWQVIGGTSVACPVVAAITNLRGAGTSPANYTTSSHRELLRIYFNLLGSYYADITSGTAGSFQARSGWDYITGIGRPTQLFPNFIPPATMLANAATKYQGSAASGSVSNLTAADGITYDVGTTLTSSGQSAALQTDFAMDQPLGNLTSAYVQLYTRAPLGTAVQFYFYNWSTKLYDYSSAFAGTGTTTAHNVLITANHVDPVTRQVRVLTRGLKALRLGTSPFTLSTDQAVLQEVTVPPWDVNLPV